MVKLTEKQKRFADYYIELGNATQAAIKAGYSSKYAKTNASKLLQNTTIKSYIDERLSQLASERIVSAEEVLEFLSSIMRNEQKEEVLKGVGMGAQAKTHIEVSAKDRVKAAELLGKRYALFTDKTEMTVTEVPVFLDDLGDPDG